MPNIEQRRGSRLWTPSRAREEAAAKAAAQRAHHQQLGVDINRSLRRARRLVERAHRRPVGSNGRDKDLDDARDLVNGALGLAASQGWGQLVRDVKGVPELMKVLNID